MKRFWLLALVFAASLLSALSAFAYEYPYTDSHYATITAGLLKSAETRPLYSTRPLNGRPERNKLELIGDRNNVDYSLFFQNKKAPLVFIGSGLGGTSTTGYTIYLAELFWKQGFHVVVLPSPYNWRFALAYSTSGYPGITRQDAKDLYRFMQDAIVDAKKHAKIQISAIAYVGLSMGALHGAYLSELDSQEQKLKIERFLLINPPVDLMQGIGALDSYFGLIREIGVKPAKELMSRLFNFGYSKLFEQNINDPNYFKDLDKQFPTTEIERRFIIGASLREFLAATIFVTQQIDDLGVLKASRNSFVGGGRPKEAEKYLFSDYISTFLLPKLSKDSGKKVNLEDVLPNVNFSGVAASIAANDKVYLMHNEDDFIINEEDKRLLVETFPSDRIELFPRGGHIGNLWWKENQEKILNILGPVLEKK